MFNIFRNKDTQNITSSVISNLKYNKKLKQFEGISTIEKFEEKIDVCIDSDVNIAYAENCITSLNEALNEKLFNNICESLIKLCDFEVKDYLETKEFACLYKLNRNQILKHIHELTLYISNPKDNKIGYVIYGNCDWNEEDGFIVVIYDNIIKFVGEHGNIYSPWDEYELDEYNCAVNDAE